VAWRYVEVLGDATGLGGLGSWCHEEHG